MRYAKLGRTGLTVSRFCLGTMNFGAKTPVDECNAIMSEACEAGINIFDTADVYGWHEGEGWTENIIGDWLHANPARRNGLILSSKVYGKMGKGANDQGLSAYHVRRACDASLKRLRTDHIDLYQLHHIDRTASWEEVWQALEQLVHDGKITYCGSSNFAAWQIATANQYALKRNQLGLVCEQSRYNLLCRLAELEVIPCCRAYGSAFFAWGPLGGGLLAGDKLSSLGGRRLDSRKDGLRDLHRMQLARFTELCSTLGEDESIVALAWLLMNPNLTAVVIGPRTIHQFRKSLRAFEIALDETFTRALEDIWPGPGGEAPEAYAW